jgi:hypothetical protein
MLETAEIDDAAAAAVFANPRQRKMVLALIPEALSLSELGRRTDTPLNLLHHHMRKFLRLGLVGVAGRRARAGAPIKLYRASAERFFVPAELFAAGSGEAMSQRLRAALDRAIGRTVKGAVYSHDGAGPRMRLVRHDAGAVAVDLWRELRLTTADAEALSEELGALLRRFELRSAEAGGRYIIHAAVAEA